MLFDTDVLIWMFRGSPKAAQLINTSTKRQFSVITYMEILQGAKNKTEQHAFLHFFNRYHFETLHITPQISHRAAVLIEENALSRGLHITDALIAATACENGLTLCSANQKHLRDIAALDFQPFIPDNLPNA